MNSGTVAGPDYPDHRGWSNMLIFGDNLQVLKALADSARPGNLYGKVNLISLPSGGLRENLANSTMLAA